MCLGSCGCFLQLAPYLSSTQRQTYACRPRQLPFPPLGQVSPPPFPLLVAPASPRQLWMESCSFFSRALCPFRFLSLTRQLMPTHTHAPAVLVSRSFFPCRRTQSLVKYIDTLHTHTISLFRAPYYRVVWWANKKAAFLLHFFFLCLAITPAPLTMRIGLCREKGSGSLVIFIRLLGFRVCCRVKHPFGKSRGLCSDPKTRNRLGCCWPGKASRLVAKSHYHPVILDSTIRYHSSLCGLINLLLFYLTRCTLSAAVEAREAVE